MERLNKGDFISRRKRKTTTTSTKAKRKNKPTPNTSDDVILASLSSLPNDLLTMIVARVPILYYRNMSQVSKSFRSMVASPELYKVRSDLGLTESCLYVCLRFGLGTFKWHTLSSKISGGYVLGRVPMRDDDSPLVGLGYSDLVAVGSDIYNIGESYKTYQQPTSGVWILDCKSHTWRKASSMPMELESISASVLDQKIYVLGRRYHQDGSWKDSLEVFNTNTQTWDLTWDLTWCELGYTKKTCIIDGKLHVVNLFGWVFAFNSKQGRWDLAEQHQTAGDIMSLQSCCEIDNVLYSVSNNGALRWYDTDNTMWRDLKGLVELPSFANNDYYAKLMGCGGGKMMVLWSGNFRIHRLSHMETIYCAEIALERRNGDCWGKLEWYDGVLSVPAITEIVKVLAVTL